MGRGLKIVVAMLLLLSVSIVFISPWVDLDPTTMRSAQVALALALTLAAYACLLCCLLREQTGRLWLPAMSGCSPGNLLNLICSRIC